MRALPAYSFKKLPKNLSAKNSQDFAFLNVIYSHIFSMSYVYQGTVSRSLWCFLVGPSVSVATLKTSELDKMKMSETLLALFILSLHLYPVTKTLSEFGREVPGRRLELGQVGYFSLWEFLEDFRSDSACLGIQQFC